MRIISTVMLSKQARTNCSLRSIIPCKRGKYSGQKDRGVPGQESHKPRTNSCSRVVTPEHPPTFNYELALEQWLPKSGTDTFFFPPNDLKNSYSRLMTVQNLQFSFTPQKLQPCFLQHCIVSTCSACQSLGKSGGSQGCFAGSIPAALGQAFQESCLPADKMVLGVISFVETPRYPPFSISK